MVRKVSALLALAVMACAQPRRSAADDEAAIRALEARWDSANLAGDADALDAVFADSFIATGDDGVVRTKAEMLGELKSGNVKYQSAATDQVRIRLYGDSAVVNGRWRGTYSYKGKSKSLLERFTNVYVRQNGQWRCVATHGSAIR
jgi:uncharacterized protein (TIGR02246 family)